MANRKSQPGPEYDMATRARLEKYSVLIPFSGCRIWTGAHFPSGYGKLAYLGRVLGAHRVSYMANVGEIPDGMFVCHTCDVPACINPTHLFIGSQQENMDDMVRKGRAATHDIAGELNPMFGRSHSAETIEKMSEAKKGLFVGSKHPRATISEDLALTIKSLKGSMTARAVSESLGVSFNVVRNIWSNKSWGFVRG